MRTIRERLGRLEESRNPEPMLIQIRRFSDEGFNGYRVGGQDFPARGRSPEEVEAQVLAAQSPVRPSFIVLIPY